MRTKLITVGNSLGIVIEKPILELLDIGRETELEVTTDGERLVIEPVNRPQRTHGARVSGDIDEVLSKHAETMKKLAK